MGLKRFTRKLRDLLRRPFRRQRGNAGPASGLTVAEALRRLAADEPPHPPRPLEVLRAEVARLRPDPLPRVTAVVACYNYGRLVAEAVASLRAQSYAALEIIVVDDGSTDSVTQAALAELEAAGGVQLVRQANQGLVGARRAGADAATGEYLLFLDNDDRIEPEAVALLVAALHRRPDCAFAYPAQHFFGDQNLVWEPQDYNAWDLLWSNHPTVCSLIRRRAFQEVGGYDKSMVHGWEDWELWVALSARGHFGLSVPVPCFRYRRHGKTMAHDAESKGAILRGTLLDKHAQLYQPERLAEIKHRWRPAVSVIIPFCNAHRWFAETHASLQRQTFDDFEILVVDDASDHPDSLALLRELRERAGLRVITRDRRGDLSAVRNTGVRAARGEFVFFLDPDDLLAPAALEQLTWLLLTTPDAAFTYTGVVHFGAKSGTCIDAYDAGRLQRENFLTSAALIHREVYLRVGGMEERERLLFEDWDFWLRLAAVGLHGRLLPEPLFFYRRHDEGRSAWVRRQSTDEQMHEVLRARNPVLYGRAQRHPEHYRPMAEPARDPVTALASEMRERYRSNLKVPYEACRRPNVPNPFPSRHWRDSRVHILYLVPYTPVGGAERVDLDILEGLDRARFHVTVCVERSDESEWRERFRAAAEELFVLPHVAPQPEAQRAFLNYLLWSRCIDVVLNRNCGLGYALVPEWRRQFPHVRYTDLLHVHNRGADWCRASVPCDPDLHRRFVISAELRQHLQTEYGLHHERFSVIYCGIHTGEWSPERTPPGSLRRALGFSEQTPILGFVGRLHEQKDPLRWLQMAEILAAKDPAPVFVMIGDGPEGPGLRAAHACSPHAGRIHLLGHRDDVRELVRDFDVLVMSSRYEGLPLVVFEAMSLGVPVVATDVGATRECVGDGLGEVVPADALPEVLAGAAARWLVRRHDVALRAACRERICTRFDVRTLQQRYRDEFTALAAECDRAARWRNYADTLMRRSLF